MPPQERDPAVIRQTLVWPKVMVAMGAVIAVALTLFYAVPYQRAIASIERVVGEVAL
jgi:HAMP domain-containing protein